MSRNVTASRAMMLEGGGFRFVPSSVFIATAFLLATTIRYHWFYACRFHTTRLVIWGPGGRGG